MPEIRCKRCNRVLKNKESIKLGYGAKCYRIIELQEQQNTPNEDYTELKNKCNQLSLKYTILERKLQKLIENGVSDSNLNWNVNRNKPDTHRPERNTQVVRFNMVVKELRVIFTEDFDYHDVLNPINSIEIPVNPPMAIEVLNF